MPEEPKTSSKVQSSVEPGMPSEAIMRSHGKKAGWKLEGLVWWGLQG